MRIVGASAGLEAVRRAVARVAPTGATVLILGETGTGKELIARSIHEQSHRRDRAFVAVNCAALAPGLIASELFGHEAGAFTGAIRQRVGRIEQADGGTLFLDEVGEMPTEAQVALLRVLQERTVERVGSGHPIAVDVRIVAATNRSLSAAVKECRFREDLFFRLNVFPITIPPLRDRPGDIAALAAHFAQHFAAEHGRPVPRITPGTLATLAVHNWPGNVRELQNLIERAVIMTDAGELAFDPGWVVGASASETAKMWAAQERDRILDALRATSGRVYGPGGAAHRLGLNPTTLYGKMRKHGIARSESGWAAS